MNRFAMLMNLTLLAATAAAQPKPATLPSSTPASDSVIADDYLLTISLHNQRLDAVVKQISQASGANVLLLSAGVPDSELPVLQSLELKDVGIRQALAALIETVPETSLAPIAIGDRGKRQNQRDVYMIRYIPRAASSEVVTGQEQQLKIYNLSSFAEVSENRLSDVLSLIDVALGEFKQQPAAEVKFHRQTNTLIVKGAALQQTAVADVIASQTQTPKPAQPMIYVEGIENAKIGELNPNKLSNLENQLQTELDRVRQLQQLMSQPTTKPAQR